MPHCPQDTKDEACSQGTVPILELWQGKSAPSWFLPRWTTKQTAEKKQWDDQKPGIDAGGKRKRRLLDHWRMGEIESRPS
ncbi:hypothetical protein KSX_53120 [Ktedonospora formicarum]|uniref:Uncharacterized protein n=1 Tax=Ktedonospora formicarum TaxID=2778364 RepID=A0A8J3I861_9CHLR|nr:hypothetical protein KSX_53120 [Ktedonospora formicarum]